LVFGIDIDHALPQTDARTDCALAWSDYATGLKLPLWIVPLYACPAEALAQSQRSRHPER